jgi:hypothetical protein
MGDISDRSRRVEARFSQPAREVPDAAWDDLAPCDGWMALDVVRHLGCVMPAFLTDAGGATRPRGR